MDEQKKATIFVGASEVAGDRRHLYLLFQKSDGSQTVVRGGPDTRAEGNDLENFAESTVLGSEKFGHIIVQAAPYVAPYEVGYRLKQDGNYERVPLNQLDPSDPGIARDVRGDVVKETIAAPDWPAPGERHERIVAWSGSDQELAAKLESAVKAGEQINHAQLEYSPLHNNSNGVVSNLLKASGVQPVLPKNAQGETVNAPDFGEDLYQDVGAASVRSGYRFDGKQWFDADDRRIAPPTSGQPLVPQDPAAPSRGSSDGFKLSAQAPSPSDPMFAQIQDGVHRIDHSLNRVPDAASDRMTWSLYALAKEQGLERVDSVVLGEAGARAAAGEYVFLVQGDPSTSVYHREQMRTADAVESSVEQSQARVQSAEQTRALAMSAETQEQSQKQDAPRMQV
ncbi:XVIPCD domain-containing protein [Xanthomonas nasturtii]|uniref:XVIPCD domain-containing protein n=1 Tax=Xanthomonas TaxID=338 RepID=UPI002B226808|nr:XVIPCD domain-containing protein [Xanthomonas nasturtii]MEA9555498.1 XVIPCD domain-containing protein [Xanthomonas nasturtii]